MGYLLDLNDHLDVAGVDKRGPLECCPKATRPGMESINRYLDTQLVVGTGDRLFSGILKVIDRDCNMVLADTTEIQETRIVHIGTVVIRGRDIQKIRCRNPEFAHGQDNRDPKDFA